jgi:hypothetical protein
MIVCCACTKEVISTKDLEAAMENPAPPAVALEKDIDDEKNPQKLCFSKNLRLLIFTVGLVALIALLITIPAFFFDFRSMYKRSCK